MTTPLIVANTFIDKYGQQDDLTHMKLQKLVFFADGWSRAFNDRLFQERPQVWRYGPVYRSLYSAMAKHGSKKVTEPFRPPSFVNNGRPPILDPQNDQLALSLVDWIWDRYGGFDGGELSTKTHEVGTPWWKMAVKYDYKVPPNLEIEDEIFDSYFKSLARAEGLIEPAIEHIGNPA